VVQIQGAQATELLTPARAPWAAMKAHWHCVSVACLHGAYGTTNCQHAAMGCSKVDDSALTESGISAEHGCN
jgi:hypothetical protein